MLLIVGCGGETVEAPARENVVLPRPLLAGLEPSTRSAIEAARAAVDRQLATRVAATTQAEAVAELGRRYFAHGFHEAAAACFEAANHLAPERFAWWYLGGVAYQRAGDLALAGAHLDHALALAPTDQPARLRRGRVALDLGQPSLASEHFQWALDQDPASAAAHFGLGLVARDDQPTQAVEHFLAALDADASADAIHHPLAMAYRDIGALAEAKTHLARAGTRRPSFADPLVDGLGALLSGARVHVDQGSQARRTGDRQRALEHFARAVEIDPKNARAQHNLGALLGELGRHTEAEGHLRQAAALAPRDLIIHLDHGTALAALGRLPEALAAFEAALAIDPDHAEAAHRRARVAEVLAKGAS